MNAALAGVRPVFLQGSSGALVDLLGGSTIGHLMEHAGSYGSVSGIWVIRLLHPEGVIQTVYAVGFDHLHDAVVYAADVDGDYEHAVVSESVRLSGMTLCPVFRHQGTKLSHPVIRQNKTSGYPAG